MSMYNITGFASPAQDYAKQGVSFDEKLNLKAPHIYVMRAAGNSLSGVGIFDNDFLVVDRAVDPGIGHVVVVELDGDLVARIFDKEGCQVVLRAAHPDFKPRFVLESEERRLAERLNSIGINTAYDLSQADTATIRKIFNVVLEKTVRELRGTSCLSLNEIGTEPKQQIICSRMFGHRVTELAPLKEAIATYCSKAAERLRKQGSLCQALQISIRTSYHDGKNYNSRGAFCQLPYPTDDTRLLIKAALQGVESVYISGLPYARAEIMLLDICQKGEFTDDLFSGTPHPRREGLMSVVDRINNRWGGNTVRPARIPSRPEWQMRREMKSPAYTTRWGELRVVRCD